MKTIFYAYHRLSTVDHRPLTTLKLLASFMLVSTLTVISGCKDEEKPKSLATVSTLAPTDITTTTAIAHGEITNDGNAKITESGFVYSNALANPTTADEKIVVEAEDDVLQVLLEDLSSGSTYHIRTYAINSEGTAYGDAMEFETGNAAPVAEDISIEGDLIVGQELTGEYTYVDAEGDPESGTTYQWYLATQANGSDATAITGATNQTYIVQDEDFGKYLQFSVTPKSSEGTLTGVETKSLVSFGVGEETEVRFMYMGVEVTYGIVKSTATGRKWLDRNLGAQSVPTAFNNANNDDNFKNYGDLFQWGRRADGHQTVVRTGPFDADATGADVIGTPTEPILSSTDVPTHGFFIVNDHGNADWRDPQNHNLWQGVTGINNPCPAGWRIPTQAEWQAEGIGNLSDGFSKLKLTLTGTRNAFSPTAQFSGNTNRGRYWTSNSNQIPGETWVGTIRMTLTTTAASFETYPRADGYACRCIKD